jgi:hypothetical protein
MLRASVQGTTSLLVSALARNGTPLRASASAKLRSVVFMSTISAVVSELRGAGHVFTERDWNDGVEREGEQGGHMSGYLLYQARCALSFVVPFFSFSSTL